MSRSLLLLMLLVCSAQASHFYGTVMTYHPKNTNADGSMRVVLRYKLNFDSCRHSHPWTCLSGNCGTGNSTLQNVDEQSGREPCQREGILSRKVPSNAPFQLLLSSGNWINNNKNGIRLWRAVTLVELRNRSDTGQANRSPQTTVLPAVRVPSNCQRDFKLLAFDHDGDEVKCRYGNTSLSECNPCTPPSVLSLSSSCTLSFSPTSSSDEGLYVVQLVVEDFPRQDVTLTQTNGSQEVKTTSNAISKLPVQFVVKVEPVVPSCTEGLYLPKFLPPTPANGAQLYSVVNQTLKIGINAEANISMISELLFSGPFNANQTTSAQGQYILRWTPSEIEDGENHPICFVVQAVFNSVKYDSELRCVIVSVRNEQKITTTIQPTTTQKSTTITLVTAPDNTAPSTTPVTEETTTTPVTKDATTTPVTEDTTTTPVTEDTTPVTEDTTTTPVTEDTTTTPVTEDTTPVTEDTNRFVIGLRVGISSSSPLSDDDIRAAIVQQIKDELVRRGLPSDIILLE